MSPLPHHKNHKTTNMENPKDNNHDEPHLSKQQIARSTDPRTRTPASAQYWISKKVASKASVKSEMLSIMSARSFLDPKRTELPPRFNDKPVRKDLKNMTYGYPEQIRLQREKRRVRRRNWTEADRLPFESSRRVELYDHDIHVFELVMKEAQNAAICNFSVIPIPNPGGRVPDKLEHAKCNYVGNRCRERGSYCCVQLYKNVDVTYPNRNDTIKLYTGCVCALQIYGTLKSYNPKLPLDD